MDIKSLFIFAGEASSDTSSTPTSAASSETSGDPATTIGTMWDQIVNFFSANVWNIVKFFSVLLIGIIFIWIIMAILKRILKAKEVDPMAIRFSSSIIRFALGLVLVLVLLDAMGVQVTGITTAISAAILAVGMALKDNLSNLANGLILVGSKKYRTGDYIIVGSVEGSIVSINFLFTTLKTPDGKQVVMPNSTMVNSQVTNLGAYAKRRINLTFSVAYESDVEQVKQIILDVMHSDGRVYLDPAPFCRLKTLNASSIDFFANCWVDKEDYWDVYYYLMETIFNEFKRQGVSIPYAQMEVRQRVDTVNMPVLGDKIQSRVEKKRVKKRKKVTFEDLEDASLAELVQMQKEEAEAAKEKAAQRKAQIAEAKKKAKENDKKAKQQEKEEKKKEKEEQK